MLKTNLEVFSPTNVRMSTKAGNNGENDSNEVDRREVRENLLKVNSCRVRFLISEAIVEITHWGKAFTKIPILHHFDPELRHIWIETNIFGFAIGEILS